LSGKARAALCAAAKSYIVIAEIPTQKRSLLPDDPAPFVKGESRAFPDPQKFPHAVFAATVAEAFGVNPKVGLRSQELPERRERFGKNTLQSVRRRSAWRILLAQFFSIIVALLAAAALIALATGDLVEAVSILVVLVINALVGFATEWQAGRALEALRKQTQITARVRRDGDEQGIDAEELLPGDVVIINAGDRVPADGRLLEAASLFAEESALTGESTTVEKQLQPVAANALLVERTPMLYLGTSVATGRALLLITAIGKDTELGRIGRLVAEAPDESTPLEEKLAELGRRLVYIVMGIAAVIFIAGWIRGDGLWMMIEVSISLAVAAVPEGLPAVTTLILALGVLAMARQRALVRRLPAVETLGSTTVICTDKTGTLTENRMTVREYFLADGRTILVSDSPDGRMASQTPGRGDEGGNENPLEDYPADIQKEELFLRILRIGALCNEASAIKHPSGQLQTLGDPTETALLVVAQELSVDVQSARAESQKIDEIPFDANSRRMVTVHCDPCGTAFAALKGAPAVVLDACSHYAKSATEICPLDEEMRQRFLKRNEEMASDALRVLALAEKRFDDDLATEARQSPEADSSGSTAEKRRANLHDGYTLLGFVGMIDPPRPEVPAAIKEAQEAGIRVVMMTGDQLHTAQAIARELRLSGDQELRAVHARELQDADHQKIAALARQVNVFARVSPEDKLHIVDALKQANEIVAVTGDGVNDAPALKRADIGIAMGLRGTDVAREAADVVLADDNFATILKAIEGGRTIYANIIKFVHMMFSHNSGEVMVIFTAILIGLPLPLLPLQILWMNLVTDIFPAFALALEPSSLRVMKHRPRSPQEALLSRRFLLLISWQGAMLAAISLTSYVWALRMYGEGAQARTIALFSLIAVQLGHFFNCRSRTRSAFEGLFVNPFVWVAAALVILLQIAAAYFQPLARVLDVTRPSPIDWLVLGACFVAPILIVELTKWLARRWKKDHGREVVD
jgi:Ca2+-transporting ATPase